jgi:hypothetical protein
MTGCKLLKGLVPREGIDLITIFKFLLTKDLLASHYLELV